MSSSSSTKAGKGKYRASTAMNRSQKAGLQFPVSCIRLLIKDGNYAERVSSTAAVYLSAVLEYLSAEVCALFVSLSLFLILFFNNYCLVAEDLRGN